MSYRHTQVGTLIVVPVIVVSLIALVVLRAMPGGMYPLVAFVTVAAVGLALAIFSTLTVEINGGTIKLRFGVGLIQKQIQLSDVDHALPVRNPWWVGWGIRWYPGNYWMWNVSGLRAVELVMKNGRRFRIGTDEPEELVRAIELSMKMPSHPPA